MMTWSAVVLQAAVKGSIIVALAGLATALLRNHSAALRHQVWTGAVIAQLALLALVPVLPTISLPLLPRMSWSIEPTTNVAGDVGAAAPQTRSMINNGLPVGSTPSRPAAPNNASNTTSIGSSKVNETDHNTILARVQHMSWREVLVAIWLTGMSIVLLRFAYGTIVMARLARNGERVEDGTWLTLMQRTAKRLGILRPLTLLHGNALSVPVTWGVIYPIVLLPAEASQWSEERRRFVLVHEMAHVKRFDALTQLVAQLAVAVFWFSPLVWIAEQRMRVEREHACDDVVIGEGTRPTTYADELLQMVRAMGTRQRSASAPAFAALAMARRSEFEGRMLAILDPSRPRAVSNVRGALLAAIALVIVAAPLAALSPFAAAPAAKSAAKPAARTKTNASNASDTSQHGATTTGVQPGLGARMAGAASNAASRIAGSVGGCGMENLRRSGASTHTEVSGDDASSRKIEFLWSVNGRCLESQMHGPVKLTADESAVASMGAGATLYLRERTLDSDRVARIHSGTNGIAYEFGKDNANQSDAASRAWVARVLPEVMRESAIDAERRMDVAIARGGVSEALRTISLIKGSSSKSEHFKALLQRKDLDASGMTQVIGAAMKSFDRMPSDLAAVLGTNRQARQNPANASMVERALRSITSSGSLQIALKDMVPGADRETLLMIADVASSMQSDGDKTVLLTMAAPYYLTRHDDALRIAYFKTFETIQSDGSRSVVLTEALKYAHGNDPLTMSVIRGVHNTHSSGSKSVVLSAVAREGLVTSPALRDAFAHELESQDFSDGDRSVVLQALLHGKNK